MEKKLLNLNSTMFELMRQRGITQTELSKRTGIATSTISDWKKKGTIPSSDKIPLICDALQISTEELLGHHTETKLKQRVITEEDDLWEFVCAYDDMEKQQKKRLLAYVKALMTVGE